MVSQQIANLSNRKVVRVRVAAVPPIYTLGVTVAYAAPTRLVRVRIFEGMPYIISGGAEVGESGRAVNPLPLAEWVRIPPP